jgi:hypothetical protein
MKMVITEVVALSVPRVHHAKQLSVWGRLRDAATSLLVVLVLMLLVPHGAWAQATATLTGVVRDPSGALISGANVVLQNTQTTAERETQTNGSGLYVFVSVPPGDYNLEVSKAGFSNAKQEKLTIDVNQALTQDFTLKIGSNTQSITVEATAVALDTGNATMGATIEQKQVNELPLNGRNFTQLLTLTPGVSPISTAQNSGGAQAAPLGSFTFPAVNGQSNRSNYFMMDGIDDTDMVFTTYALAPIIDDIQEFKVQSHNDEVQFGGATGGMINVVTKSGTNDYHATAWEYLRNTDLDAKNPFSGIQKLEQNQFGVNGGGPVRLPFYNGRNKTFFFGSYEGFRRAEPSSTTFYNVPTMAEESGDFSAICQTGFTAGICNDRTATGLVTNQLYNPFTTTPDPAHPGQYLRTPFSNNNISSALNAGAVTFAQDVFPAPKPVINNSNGYDFRPVHTRNQEYSWRFDEDFDASNSAFFRYSANSEPTVGTGGTTEFNNITTVDALQYVASYYHNFSSSTIFDFEFGHDKLTNSPATTFLGNTNSVISAAGISSSFACGFESLDGRNCLLPGVSIANYGGSPGEGSGFTNLTNNYEWRGNLTKVIRQHSLTFGVSYEADRFRVDGGGVGETFGTDQTGDPENAGNTGNAMASFLIGVADQGNKRTTNAPVTGQKGIGAYFMDKWNATKRLTLNLGLRYDLQLYPMYGDKKDGTDAIGEIDFNNGTYILQDPVASCANTGNIAPCIPGTGLPPGVVVSPNGRLWNNTYTNFQPRVGLAFRLDSKTVLRAGFGIADDLWAGITQTVQGIGGVWPSNNQPITPTNALGSAVTANWQNPLAGGAVPTNAPAPTPFQQVAFYRDPDAKNPYSEQWNFGLERQFSGNTVVSANYVGSENHRDVVGSIYNTALTPGPNLNPDGTAPTTPAEAAADFATRQQWPGISPTFYDRGVGSGSYNSLQILAKRQAAHGLSFLLSYTWSKTIDVGSDGFFGVENTSVQNPYNLSNDRSVAGYDLPQVFSASFTAESPFGKNKRFSSGNGALDYVVGNWQLNGIYTYTSGQDFTVTLPGDIANINGGVSPPYNYERANVVGDPNLPNPTANEWFNTAAFSAPATYTFGDSGRNMLRGDKFNDFDMSLFRAFPFGETRSFQFRAEAFNLFNHDNLGQPDSTVGDKNYGIVTSTRGSVRQLQVALRLVF